MAVSIVAGATLGAFFSAVGRAIHASKGTNDLPVPVAFADSYLTYKSTALKE